MMPKPANRHRLIAQMAIVVVVTVIATAVITAFLTAPAGELSVGGRAILIYAVSNLHDFDVTYTITIEGQQTMTGQISPRGSATITWASQSLAFCLPFRITVVLTDSTGTVVGSGGQEQTLCPNRIVEASSSL